MSAAGGAAADATARRTVAILALDVPAASDARRLLERVPGVEWVKVGLQLFTAEGPALVRELRDSGYRVFLDIKLHDIPNTVAGAVGSAAALGVELLTLHGSGGAAMLRAARTAAGEPGSRGPRLFAVTLLTSLSAAEAAEAWGRPELSIEAEARRLARLARDAGMDGVVAAVHEADAIRAEAGRGFGVLAPGIRLAGDAAGDQARVATPEEAARREVDYIVIGRTVTAAADPAAAWERVLDGILPRGRGVQRTS